MDTRLDENQAELGVLVLAVALEMLADGDGLAVVKISSILGTYQDARPHVSLGAIGWRTAGEVGTHLLDQHVQVLGDIGGEAYRSLCQHMTEQRHKVCVFVYCPPSCVCGFDAITPKSSFRFKIWACATSTRKFAVSSSVRSVDDCRSQRLGYLIGSCRTRVQSVPEDLRMRRILLPVLESH